MAIKEHKKQKNKTLKQPANKAVPNNNIYIIIILALTAIVFSNAITNGFTNWDDNTYLQENDYIKDLSMSGISNMFSHSYFGNYHPLTMLTYSIEYAFFGFSASVFHFNNIVLHLINTLLVFLFIKQLSKRIEIPVITSFIFAVHPMHVESVAWVAERKDVLYTMFFLFSLIFYVKFLKNTTSIKYLIFAFVFFVCSLMSKSAAVVTPLIMLLTLYYIRRKINIKEALYTLPFFIMSLVFGIIAINTQVEALGNLNALYPGINRVLIVIYAIYFYIVRFILPFNLSALHGFPVLKDGLLPVEYYMAPFVILLIAALYYFSKKEFRQHLLFGLLFYIISLVLVIQILPVGQAVVAERYAYVPYIGLSLIFAYGYVFLQKYVSKNLLLSIAAIFALFLMVTTWQQNKAWENSEVLWTKVLSVYPDNQIAFNNRGLYRTDKEMYKEAFDDFNRLVEINPDYKDVFNNRATACFKIKDYACVVKDLTEAIARNPKSSKLYNNRGLAKSYLKDMQGAIADYTKAIEMDSLYFDAYNNRINAKNAINDFQGALNDLGFLIKNNPNNAGYFNTRGILYGSMKNFNEALNDFNQAIAIDAKMAEAYTNKGITLLNMGNTAEACANWQTALNLGNKNANNWIGQYCNKK